MAKRIQVGGRIESKEVGGIVTGAAEILDDAKEKKQSVINQETDDELVRLEQSKQDNLTFDNAPTEGSDNPVKSGGVYAADKALSDAIEAILLLIPSAASALNKLVDTSMMNSSISTATATFRGTYNVVTDLSLTVDATHEQIAESLGNVISTADNNDYAFVQVPVSAESTDIRRTERYKFNGTEWGYEYDLNTSGFTAAQWAAINSGITIALVGKLIGLPTSSELQALLGQKQDTLTFDNIPVSASANPVKSGGVYSAINDEKTAREQLANTVTGIDGRVGNVEELIPTGATANNKLVANNSMEAYVTSIIDAITASFTIATADGHINLTLTQTNGRVASLTLTSSDIASAQALTALTGRVSTAESNITSLGGRVSTNETDIANLQQLYNDLQESKPEPVTALPETGQQQGVIYRLAGTTSYSDYMWNGSSWVLMATYNNAIDPRPKKSSQNLVTSGGVFDNMGALDVSELNATENPHTLAQYTDLSAALAAIPTDYQKGGMSIKFVQSSDNKYVCYMYKGTATTGTPNPFLDTTNWEKINLEEEVHQLCQDVPTKMNIFSSGAVASNDDDKLSILDKKGNCIFEVDKNGVRGVGINTIFSDDLKTQKIISPIIGQYGQEDAVYKVKTTEKCRVVFDFEINDNLNVSGTDKSFIHLSGSMEKDVKTTHAIPQDLYLPYNKLNDPDSPAVISQAIGYRSGFDIFGKSIVRTPGQISTYSAFYSEKTPLVGKTALVMWLYGDFAKSDYPSSQDISDRSQLLSGISNATISFSNDVLTVTGVSENPISVNAKNNGTYKSLPTFYNDLESALGSYFAFKRMDLSASKDAGDLLQFGTVNLVSYYWQQLDPTSSSCGYLYDSFPILIPLAIDESTHHAEIICTDGYVYVSIDGDWNKYADTVSTVTIGGTESTSGLVTCKNLRVEYNTLGDAIIDNTYGIVSEQSPRLIGIMLHKILNVSESEVQNTYEWSISRYLDVMNLLKERGYKVIGIKDLVEWLSGNIKIPARCAFILATSEPFTNYINTDYARELISSNGIKTILGTIIKTELHSEFNDDEDAMFKAVMSALQDGYDFVTHAYSHNSSADPGVLDYKGSLILQQELYKLVDLCKETGVSNQIYTYGPSCRSVNFMNMLSYMGFVGAIGGGLPYTIASTSRYMVERINAADNAETMEYLRSIFI